MECLPQLSGSQWLVVLTMIVEVFCLGMSYSVQAPFYPQVAKNKGCIPSEYGLVFGIMALVKFVLCPIIGANLKRFGMKATIIAGIMAVGLRYSSIIALSILHGLHSPATPYFLTPELPQTLDGH